MSNEKFIMVSLDDEKSKDISEILGSKTCKKIINYLAENKEASEKDLSDLLKIPINTVDYNMKKMLSAGFIQKRKNFFWSKKGKKIIMYELSNKSVVISPKKSSGEKIKSIIPAFILTAAGTFAVWVYEKINSSGNILNAPQYSGAGQEAAVSMVKTASDSGIVPYFISPQPFPLWGWFLAGALLAIIILSIVNWRKL